MRWVVHGLVMIEPGEERATAQNALEFVHAIKKLAVCGRPSCRHEALPAGQSPVDVGRDKRRLAVRREERVNSPRYLMQLPVVQLAPKEPGHAELVNVNLGALCVDPESTPPSSRLN